MRVSPLVVLLTGLAGAATLTAAPAPVRADADAGGVRAAAPSLGQRRWSAQLAVDTRWMTDSSAAVAVTSPLTGPRYGVSRHLLGLELPRRRVDLAVGARVGLGNASGELFQRLTTELDQQALLLGVEARATAWRWLSLAASVEAGAARTHLTITDPVTGMVPVDDGGWGALASAAVGADVELVRRPRFALSMGLVLGYAVTTPVAIAAMPGNGADPALSIQTGHAALGQLDTRGTRLGVSWRVGF